MKRLMQTSLFLVGLTFSWAAHAQKADGYAYTPLDDFTPGLYEATRDVSVYFNVDDTAVDKTVRIPAGTRISVYSAGYHGAEVAQVKWFSLTEGQECNGTVLPWDNFGWVGVHSKDFVRIEDLPKPVYKMGTIQNCVK